MSKGNYRKALTQLGHWYRTQKRALPWRDRPSLYRVWVSEIMLQQTQVATVIPYFERFMARFPDVKNLAKAPEAEVLEYWAGLGYYSRARNLHRGARVILQRGFPRSLEGWLAVPGVGPYTAGAVLSIAMNQPVPILDGNIERVFSRLRRIPLGERRKQRLWRLAAIFVRDGKRWGIRPSDLNQSLMELGATVCLPAAKPHCHSCPLARLCRARARGEVALYPPKKPRRHWKKVNEQLHLIVNRRGEVLLRQRQAGEWRAGLWDLVERPPARLKLTRLGEVQTRHVVTTHKISRQTTVWQVNRCSWTLADSAQATEWFSLSAANKQGAALKRTLAAANDLLSTFR